MLGLIVVCLTGFIYWQVTKKPKTSSTDTFIVGTNPEFPPFEFVENGENVGFDIDLVEHVAHKLNKKLDIKSMSFDALIPAAQIGSIHFIAAGMTPTPERAQRLIFTKPYLTGDPLWIVTMATATPVKTPEDLKSHNVVVPEGFTADLYMSKIEGVNLIRLGTTSDCFLALTSGRADAFVAAQNSITPFFAKKNKADFAITPIEGTSEPSALGISKKYPELLPVIQKALDELKQEGVIDSLKAKWKIS